MSTDIQNMFTVKYGGEQNEITANTLVHSLMDIATIIQEVNKELGTGKPLDIKIKALRPGSFLVDIHLLGVFEVIRNFLNVENFKTTSELIGAVIGIIKLRQLLKKQDASKAVVLPSQQGGTVTITNMQGGKLEIDNRTYNIYVTNSKVREALNNNFETLQADPDITSFEVLDEQEKPLVAIPREEFPELTTGRDSSGAAMALAPDESPKLPTVQASLYIVRVSFDKKLKWDFVYKENKITAKIEDDDFTERVISGGEEFRAGDVLEVEMHITQKLEESAQVLVNKGYKIIKVLRHIKRNEQIEMFSDDDAGNNRTRTIRFDGE